MEKNPLNIEITYANRSVRLSEKGHYLYISAAISYISLMKNLLLLQRTWWLINTCVVSYLICLNRTHLTNLLHLTIHLTYS